MEIMPDNYSPINFNEPDYEMYPEFSKAKVYKIHLTAGDCLYLPGNWWHYVISSPEVTIAVNFWYEQNSYIN